MIWGIIFVPILKYECISLYVRMYSLNVFNCSIFYVRAIILLHINTKSLAIRCNIESVLQLHCYFWKILLHYICSMNFIIFFEINADYVTIPSVQDLSRLLLSSSFYLSYQIFIKKYKLFYYNHFISQSNTIQILICCLVILLFFINKPFSFLY